MMAPRYHSFADFLSGLEPSSSEPQFRAPTTGEKRKALRLEGEFWSILTEISKETGEAPGAILQAIDESASHAGNFASAVRAVLASWQSARVSRMEKLLSEDTVRALVNASPAPTFALTTERHLIFNNAPFLRFLRMGFAGIKEPGQETQMKLQLDLTMSELVDRLAQAGNQPVETGFVVGMNDKRLRGRVNVLLAPIWRKDVILGYVVS